jgi:hypothetical protein
MQIDQFIEELGNLDQKSLEKLIEEKFTPEQIGKLAEKVSNSLEDTLWIPNLGAQTQAYLSQADEIYYGGAAGGGKTALLCGLAVSSHEKSIIFRREYPQIKGLEDEVVSIIGSRAGYNSQDKIWRLPKGNVLEFGAVQHEQDVEKFQGRPHDLICFDELPHFTESQYSFLIGWNRSANPKQRCRIVGAGNPPTNPEGYWVVKRWAAWLDAKHPNPAKAGEIRWFTTINGKDIEVEHRGPHLIDGREVFARSRTFIPAKLEDNPFLLNTGYAATLEAMPEPYRTMMREGRFDVEVSDQHNQTIPTAWVQAAMERGRNKQEPPVGVPMCALAADIAQGGNDNTVLSARYDYWFAPLIKIPGRETPLGRDVAGYILKHRTHNALTILDMGGGFGSGAWECLVDNIGKENLRAYKGAEAGVGRTKDKTLSFTNKRTQAYWMMREALDPSQLGGSPICLPDDRQLLADLTAPTFEITPRGVKVEPKDAVVKRLGRSPDSGDAVVMCWIEGQRGLTPKANYNSYNRRSSNLPAMAKTGYEQRRRKS